MVGRTASVVSPFYFLLPAMNFHFLECILSNNGKKMKRLLKSDSYEIILLGVKELEEEFCELKACP